MKFRTAFGAHYAWCTNASVINASAGMAELSGVPLLGLPQLTAFAENINDLSYTVVGLKGTGKSSALGRKAALFAEHKELIAQHVPYVTSLSKIFAPSKDNTRYLHHLRQLDYWVYCWNISLKLIFCARFSTAIAVTPDAKDKGKVNSGTGFDFRKGTPLSWTKHKGSDKQINFFQELDQIMGRGKVDNDPARGNVVDLSSILQLILRYCLELHELQSWSNLYIDDEFDRALSKVVDDRRVGLFIDSIDEAFAGFKRITHENDNNIGYDIWMYIQCGFHKAVIDLRQKTGSRFSVYGAIRSEALQKYPPDTENDYSQLHETTLNLQYNRQALKEIFRYNVQNTDNKYKFQVQTENGDSQYKFFPLERYDYPYSWGLSEKPLHWLLRHTFNIPRQLVEHGKQIIETIPSAEQRNNRAKLRPVVSRTASNIFETYKKQVGWNEGLEDKIFQLASNVIENADIDVGFFHELYIRGLLGYPHQPTPGVKRYKQKFLSAGLHVEELKILPKESIPYYIIHPCLTAYILESSTRIAPDYYLNRLFIAGDGLSCPQSLYPKYVLFKDDESRLGFSCFNKRDFVLNHKTIASKNIQNFGIVNLV